MALPIPLLISGGGELAPHHRVGGMWLQLGGARLPLQQAVHSVAKGVRLHPLQLAAAPPGQGGLGLVVQHCGPIIKVGDERGGIAETPLGLRKG